MKVISKKGGEGAQTHTHTPMDDVWNEAKYGEKSMTANAKENKKKKREKSWLL